MVRRNINKYIKSKLSMFKIIIKTHKPSSKARQECEGEAG